MECLLLLVDCQGQGLDIGRGRDLGARLSASGVQRQGFTRCRVFCFICLPTWPRSRPRPWLQLRSFERQRRMTTMGSRQPGCFALFACRLGRGQDLGRGRSQARLSAGQARRTTSGFWPCAVVLLYLFADFATAPTVALAFAFALAAGAADAYEYGLTWCKYCCAVMLY